MSSSGKESDSEMETEDYLSDTPLDIKPNYPEINDSMDTVIIITTLPKVRLMSHPPKSTQI